MKRSFLVELGLEKDVIDQIMAENGTDIELAKEKAADTSEREAKKMQKKIDDLQDLIDKAPKSEPDGENWKEKYEKLNGEFDTYKQTIAVEKTTDTKKSALRKQLQSDGANPKLIDLLESKFDLAKIEIDGEKIKDWDNLVKPVKEQYSEVFGTTTVEGVNPANPPSGAQPSAYTLEQIKQMSPSQINQNWDKGVKQALEKGN